MLPLLVLTKCPRTFATLVSRGKMATTTPLLRLSLNDRILCIFTAAEKFNVLQSMKGYELRTTGWKALIEPLHLYLSTKFIYIACISCPHLFQLQKWFTDSRNNSRRSLRRKLGPLQSTFGQHAKRKLWKHR